MLVAAALLRLERWMVRVVHLEVESACTCIRSYSVLVLEHYSSVPRFGLSFLKRCINLDQMLCRSVTFKGVIYMYV